MIFGIRKKILILGLATVILTISMISSLFIFNLITFHTHNSKNEVDLIHSSISTNFNTYKGEINQALNIVANDEKLKANLSVIKNYSNFSSDNFDELRSSMASDLNLASRFIYSDFLIIFDTSNKPVVFSGSSKLASSKESFIGYYIGKNVYAKSLQVADEYSQQFKEYDVVDTFSQYVINDTNKDVISIFDYKHNLVMGIKKEILTSDGQILGTIGVFKLIDSEFLSKVQSIKDVHIIAKYNNILYGLPDELASSEKKIQQSILGESSSINIEEIELNVTEKELYNELSIVYLTNFYSLQEEVDSLKKSVIWSTALVILLLLPFGYWFVNRYINLPIDKLLEDIKNFRLNNKIVNKDTKLNDEFGVFQKAFYDMTNIIVDKETELYLKTQEQKLANRELENIVSQLKAYQIALDETSIVSKSDLEGRITYVNDKLCEKTGYTKDELIGRAHSIFKHSDTPKEEFTKLWATIANGEIYKGVIKNRAKDGSGYYVKTTIVPIFDNAKKIKEYIAVRNDITDIMSAKKELEESFYKDTLTKLPNRNQLLVDLKKEQAPKLVLLNIDSFKEINDFYGHYTGDEILVLVSQKILAHFDFVATVYKMPSDEYGLLFDSSKVENDELKKEVKRFIDELSDTYFSVDNIEIAVNLTAGLSLNSSSEDSLKNADIALKTGKKTGVFISEYDDSAQFEAEQYKNNILWAHKLKAAIKDDRIVPFYQPIYNNKTNKIEKYEVLMRLIDQDKPITPWFFLDIAKKAKLYKKLTKIIIEKSFAYFSDKDYEFSINLSAEDIESKDIKEFLRLQFEQYPSIKEKVVFEIVESEGFKNFDNVISFIQETKMEGCKIAIDDFGTGYSNFEYLLKLKADFVKIDGSLIKHINQDKNAYEVVKIIVQFAHSQGMKTIAEFVSNAEVQNVVDELGVDYSQGYFIAEPNKEVL